MTATSFILALASLSIAAAEPNTVRGAITEAVAQKIVTNSSCASDSDCASYEQCVYVNDGWSQCIACDSSFQYSCPYWDQDTLHAAEKACDMNCPGTRCDNVSYYYDHASYCHTQSNDRLISLFLLLPYSDHRSLLRRRGLRREGGRYLGAVRRLRRGRVPGAVCSVGHGAAPGKLCGEKS